METDFTFSKEYILCAAVHINDGSVHREQPANVFSGYVIAGRRHNNCYETLKIILGKDRFEEYMTEHTGKQVMGFITNTNKFVTRAEGYKIALKVGQICEREMVQESCKANFSDSSYVPDYDSMKILISEDLYADEDPYKL